MGSAKHCVSVDDIFITERSCRVNNNQVDGETYGLEIIEIQSLKYDRLFFIKIEFGDKIG